MRFRCAAAEGEERQRLAERVHGDRQLGDFRAKTSQMPVSGLDILRWRLEVVSLDDDASSRTGTNQIWSERGGGLDVDILRARRQCVLQDAPALLF